MKEICAAYSAFYFFASNCSQDFGFGAPEEKGPRHACACINISKNCARSTSEGACEQKLHCSLEKRDTIFLFRMSTASHSVDTGLDHFYENRLSNLLYITKIYNHFCVYIYIYIIGHIYIYII